MAFTNNITYCGKESFDFFSAALLNSPFFQEIQVIPNVKSSIVLPKVTTSGHIQADDSCDFEKAGDITLDPRTLEVCALKVNDELCVKDLETSFLASRMRAGSNNDDTEAGFTAYVLEQMAKELNQSINNIAWNGNTGLTSGELALCDGFLKLFGTTGSGVVTVSGTTLSASNILTELGKVYAAIPEQVALGGNVVIYMGYAASTYYQQALAAANQGIYSQAQVLNFLGVPIRVVPYIGANKMVAADPNNLWFGTDLLSDETQVLALPMFDKTMERKVRIGTYFKAGFQFGVGAEIVYYRQ